MKCQVIFLIPFFTLRSPTSKRCERNWNDGWVELHADGHPGKRGTKFQKELFWEGLHVKFTGDSGIVAPMFISEHKHIDEIIEKFRVP